MKKDTHYIAHKRKSDGKEQSVKEHLEGTARLSRIYSGKIGLPNAGELQGLLHDFGKPSTNFQEYMMEEILSWSNPDIKRKWPRGGDHSTAGAQFIWRHIGKADKKFIFLAQMLCLSISSHHSGLIDCITPDGRDNFTKRMSKASEETHYDEVREKCDSAILDRVHQLLEDPNTIEEFNEVIKRVLNAKSNTIHNFRLGMLTRFLFSCLIDGDRTDTADFEKPKNSEMRLNTQYPDWDKFIRALDERLAEFKIRNRVDIIRRDVSDACKKGGDKERGIYTLTVPTGGANTLGSLRFALIHAKKRKLKRIIFVIPYTTIIDQNAHEVRKIFSNISKTYENELVLEHHSNLTPDKDTLQCKVLSENWDAPIVFTTSVQLLESLFGSGTRGVRRMHQLAESVIVFDEIQTLSVLHVHLFNNAMNFLVDVCGSSIVLCTATQPCLHAVDAKKGRLELSEDHEIMPDVKKLFQDLKRVDVVDKRKTVGWSTDEVAELVCGELRESGSVLVVVNTKKAAQELFKCCQHIEADRFHLSTDMCPEHRMSKLNVILKNLNPKKQKPTICISTQLIEAGVDVDFGTVIRYLAGFDSIAQAGGRCNRNGLRESGRVIIVNPANENLGSLIDIEEGIEAAKRVLRDFNKDSTAIEGNLLHPDVLDRYFQYYFFNRAKEMAYPVSMQKIDQSDTILSLLSKNETSMQNYLRDQGKYPNFPLFQSFKSAASLFKAIDSKTQGIIVPYGEGIDIISKLCASRDITMEYELIKKAQRFSVNCYPDRIQRLGDSGALHNIQESGILCLSPEYYDQDYGLSDEPVSDALDFCNA